jgi:hypothetical protein
MNPWEIDRIITHAKEMATRNGFSLDPGDGNTIKLVAENAPYKAGICIGRCNDWREVECFFSGYEQHKLEAGFTLALNKVQE